MKVRVFKNLKYSTNKFSAILLQNQQIMYVNQDEMYLNKRIKIDVFIALSPHKKHLRDKDEMGLCW